MQPITFILSLIFGLSAFAAEPLTVFSLNLHGYHPYKEAPRVLEDRFGTTQLPSSHLFYFTLDELDRGHRKQLDQLATHLQSVQPDIILLQEVGAGLPDTARTCSDFHRDTPGDALGKNSALRLLDRLNRRTPAYFASLACRGNWGWVTDSQTFKDIRVLRQNRDKSKEVVFDFGENPYAEGIIVEGTAILVRQPWQISEKRTWVLQVPDTNDWFFFQTLIIRKPSTEKNGRSPWWLIANLHGGHKVQHFEQALAIREALAAYVEDHEEKDLFAGALIGGDLNARLYRPSENNMEVSTIPWEIAVPGEFDYHRPTSGDAFADLQEKLWRLNLDPYYKPWASIGDSPEARRRVNSAVERLREFSLSPLYPTINLRESLATALDRGRCHPTSELDASCRERSRIDMLFADPKLTIENAHLVFSKNSWVSLDGLSDHPGLMVVFSVP